MSNGPRSNNLHCQEMTAALEANPPEIVWEPNGHGVMVAISVKDPHERFRTHRAENTPLLNAARRSI